MGLTAAYVLLIRAIGNPPPDSSAGGGWDTSYHSGSENLCEIPRLDHLSRRQYTDKYEFRRPFVLKRWIERSGMDTSGFTRGALLARHGETPVILGASSTIAANDGSGHVNATLRAFIDRWMPRGSRRGHDSGRGDVDNPLYLFDKDDFLGTHAPELLSAVRLPDFFQATLPTAKARRSQRDAPAPGSVRAAKGVRTFFALGGAGAGVHFHFHEDAWNLQIFGRKKWLLAPHEHTPPLTSVAGLELAEPIAGWVRTVLPALPRNSRPLTCVVHPGELLYVPEQWHHATLNLEHSVGVAAQQESPRSPRARVTGMIESDATALSHQLQRAGLDKPALPNPNIQSMGSCSRTADPVSCEEHLAHIEDGVREALKHGYSQSLVTVVATLLRQAGKPIKAKKWLSAHMKRDPLDISSAAQLADITFALGRTNAAIKVLKRTELAVSAISASAGLTLLDKLATLYEYAGKVGKMRRIDRRILAMASNLTQQHPAFFARQFGNVLPEKAADITAAAQRARARVQEHDLQ